MVYGLLTGVSLFTGRTPVAVAMRHASTATALPAEAQSGIRQASSASCCAPRQRPAAPLSFGPRDGQHHRHVLAELTVFQVIAGAATITDAVPTTPPPMSEPSGYPSAGLAGL